MLECTIIRNAWKRHKQQGKKRLKTCILPCHRPCNEDKDENDDDDDGVRENIILQVKISHPNSITVIAVGVLVVYNSPCKWLI